MTISSEWPPGSIPISSTLWDSSWPGLADDDDLDYIFAFMEERFGIPKRVFDDYLLFKRKKSWSLMKKSALMESGSSLKVSKVGLKAFHMVSTFIKPTGKFIQIFGHKATKARVVVDKHQLSILFAGGDIRSDINIKMGYVILELKGNGILGLGFLNNGKVRSQIPRKEIRKNFDLCG